MALVMFGSLIGSAGAAGLKAGAHRLKFSVKELVTNWHLIAGGLGYGLSTVFFVAGLRHGDLSVLYPMVSVGSIFNLFLSKMMFGESITTTKVGAIALILTGVILLGVSGSK